MKIYLHYVVRTQPHRLNDTSKLTSLRGGACIATWDRPGRLLHHGIHKLTGGVHLSWNRLFYVIKYYHSVKSCERNILIIGINTHTYLEIYTPLFRKCYMISI